MHGDLAAADAAELDAGGAELAEILRDALADEYSDASPEDLQEALSGVLESMSAAEAFNFAKALKQIERGAGQLLADPTVNQVVRSALPVAAGALGTVIGGPAGTALGTSLGTAAAKALPGGTPPPRPVPQQRAPVAPPVAGGSAAAAQGLVLTQQPDVLKSLLSLAMGQQGRRTVSGVPVAQVMSMLSSVFGQAAADADELMYLSGEGHDGESLIDEEESDRALYAALMDADNAELAAELADAELADAEWSPDGDWSDGDWTDVDWTAEAEWTEGAGWDDEVEES